MDELGSTNYILNTHCKEFGKIDSELNIRRVSFNKICEEFDDLTRQILISSPKADSQLNYITQKIISDCEVNIESGVKYMKDNLSYYTSTQHSLSVAAIIVLLLNKIKTTPEKIFEAVKLSLVSDLIYFFKKDFIDHNQELTVRIIKNFQKKTGLLDVINILDNHDIKEVEDIDFNFVLVDVVSEILKAINDKNSLSPKSTLAMFYQASRGLNGKYDRAINMVIKNLGVYPPGTIICTEKNNLLKVHATRMDKTNILYLVYDYDQCRYQEVEQNEISTMNVEIFRVRDLTSIRNKNIQSSLKSFYYV